MRADRLLTILLLLQRHQRLTARDLAGRLEVSERTIYRDMDALSAVGVPVYAERGAGGGCALAEGYRTSLTGLTAPEIEALFVSRPAGPLADLGMGGASEMALLKLLAALPALARGGAEYARQRLHIDPSGWRQSREALPFLPILQEAIWQGHRLQLAYRRGDDTIVERTGDPLGLVAKGSIWYLVAAIEGEIRTYRVSRVQGAAMSDEACVRPEGFDLAAYWESSAAGFPERLPRYAATVRVAPEALPWLRERARYARIERADPPDVGGWTTLIIQFETERNARENVLRFGPWIEVVEPAALRTAVASAAAAVVALYDGRGCCGDGTSDAVLGCGDA